jgi:hypothetical protein
LTRLANILIGVALLAALAVVPGCGGDHAVTGTVTAAPTTSTVATHSRKGSTQKLPPLHAKRTFPRLSKPATPQAVVTAALTSSGPLACSVYVPQLLDKSYGGRDGCESAIRSGGVAKSAKIISAKVSGSSATVVAVPDGGPSSGEKLTYSLVQENGRWRLDKVHSNVKVGP